MGHLSCSRMAASRGRARGKQLSGAWTRSNLRMEGRLHTQSSTSPTTPATFQPPGTCTSPAGIYSAPKAWRSPVGTPSCRSTSSTAGSAPLATWGTEAKSTGSQRAQATRTCSSRQGATGTHGCSTCATRCPCSRSTRACSATGARTSCSCTPTAFPVSLSSSAQCDAMCPC